MEDFSSLPLNIVYGPEPPDDMVNVMNSLIKECIDRHAPLRKVKITRPPAPWLQTDEIRHLQTERDRLRRDVQKDGTKSRRLLVKEEGRS